MNMYKMGKWWVQVWDMLGLWAFSLLFGRIYLCRSISDQTATVHLSTALFRMQLIYYLFSSDFDGLLHRIYVNVFSNPKVLLFQNLRNGSPRYLPRRLTSLYVTAIRLL